MKITHICLCGPVTDNWSYQDNLLPKYHKQNGHDVSVITSKFIWDKKGNTILDNRNVYFNEYGIKTIRIESKFNTTVHSKFKLYSRLYNTIEKEKPDILFIHGIQFLNIVEIAKFLKRNPKVIAFVDNHADYSNSATNWVSEKILHKIVWRICGNIINPFTKKFYGVLPARVDFLKNVYKLPEEKVELLLLGADDEKVIEAKKNINKSDIRKKHKISEDDFLIVSGGKIDLAKKQILHLMQAVKSMGKNNLKLIVFGSITEEIRGEFSNLIDGEVVQYAGWISTDTTYNYLASADLIIFPGRHSVLWEQAVGLGVPCVFKYWEGTTHVDVGGNCMFLNGDSSEEIINIIKKIISDQSLYLGMKESAEINAMRNFSYKRIAEQSIQ